MPDFHLQQYHNKLEKEEEKQRISRGQPKPCPTDFPPKLRKYWNSSLQFSHTPIQSGWILYYQDLEKVKRQY